MFTIDFETHAIEDGSPKSPVPVGLAVHHLGKSRYYAWGHPDKNNCTRADAQKVLDKIYDSGERVLCHNAKFDTRVALEHFDVDFTQRFHDTVFLAFLNDPREDSLHLKDLADKYLDMPPDEQAELRDWLVQNVKGATAKNFGAHISKAPGDLVGKYAVGDVDRTHGLYKHWKNLLKDEGLAGAYKRELLLTPVIIDMETRGVPISPEINEALHENEKRFEEIETQLFDMVPEKPGTKAFFNRMLSLGYIDEQLIEYTEKGNPRFGREQLEMCCSNAQLLRLLTLRSKLQKVIGTYLRPWSEAFNKYGRFYPWFNQTRSDNDYGTRTGRLSSNFQQVPHVSDDPDVPVLRDFIIAEQGDMLLKRDFAGQELRIAAHFAEGRVLEAFKQNARLDIHQFTMDIIAEQSGIKLDRRITKQTGFLALYGGGPPALSAKIGCSYDEAARIFEVYYDALPEFKQLGKDCETVCRAGGKIRTWGGRLYDVEKSRYIKGKYREFYYKLLNVLIQGSAADQTKQAMIDYWYSSDKSGRILLQVHDEIVLTCPVADAHDDMALLRDVMDNQRGWDVPFMSDGSFGFKFGSMKEYDDERIYDRAVPA